MKTKFDFADWLGFNSPPDWIKARTFGRILGWCLAALTLATIATAVFGLIRLFTEIFTLDDDPLRDMGYILLGLFGAPFVVWRAIIAQKQATTAEQGLITDRINKAVAGLGTEKTVKHLKKKDDGSRYALESTVPNIEVRIGAIYSLERIAQDSERDHIQIMEILCAYIRQNAPAEGAQDHGFGDWEPPEDLAAREAARQERFGESRSEGQVHTWAQNLKPPRPDIQTALEVIGRRSDDRIRFENDRKHRGESRYQLDLRRANLQGADLSHLKLQKALLQASRLEGADLSWARLEGAFLHDARFSETTDFRPATLRCAGLKSVDLSMLPVKPDQLAETFGDRSVILPDDFEGGYPAHWAQDPEPLKWHEFDRRLRAFQASIGYRPPDA